MRRGFSLVELMIVVAIIGILAMIAIPAYSEVQERARRAELAPNVTGIKTAQIAYEATFDAYVTATIQPRSLSGDGLDRQLASWPTPNAADWAQLDWRPDGDVRGVYSTWIVGGGTDAEDFCVLGEEDVTGTGDFRRYYASATANVTTESVPAPCGSSSAT